jgi:pyruvate dehydrogenase E1 component alpha subunit
MGLSKQKKLEMYGKMVKIRFFEERIVDLYARGLVPGLAHLYIGEEAVAVGACANLRDDDYITSTHRGHGHVIAKGGDVRSMMAELFGKTTGYCKGKGGSMHIADVNIGILGANGIAGGGLPIAVGAGLSAKYRKTDQVTVCFFGDGASNNGTFHESLNLAAVHGLPVIFTCENNQYGISTAQKTHQTIKDVSVRSTAYDIPGVTVDGNDVMAVYEAINKAVQRARSGKGPTLVECKTYRWRGHHEGDPNLGERYRSREDIKPWIEKCPITRFERLLLKEKVLTQAKIDGIKEAGKKEIDEAVEFANNSSFPKHEEIYQDVFQEEMGGSR